MKAIVMERRGAPDVLRYVDLPDPEPGPADLTVAVAAAAVNPVDLKTRSGFLDIPLTLPSVLGWDVAGTVTAVGPEVVGFRVGDPVVGMVAQPAHGRGTYADTVVAPYRLFAPAPAGVDLADAAALPLAGLTAVQMLAKLDLPPEATVLVTGAAGAVGRIVVQLLVADGHTVHALARATDADDLLWLDVDRVVTSVADLSPGLYDAVHDTAGVADAIVGVRDGGGFISIADNVQPLPQRGITPGKSYVQEDGRGLARLAELLSAGQLDVPVGHRFPLADAAAAHAAFEQGGLRGKVVLLP